MGINLRIRHMIGKLENLLVLAAACLAVNAGAATITLHTSTGATAGGLPVNAEAEFVTGQDMLTITLRNLLADPGGVIQCISGLSFTLDSGQTVGTLISSSGIERAIGSDGHYTDGTSAVSSGWLLSGSSLYLNDLAGQPAAGPAHTLIGPPNGSDIYTGNGSILGNGPHNPFLAGDLTFVLSIPGLTAQDSVTDALFQFGTTATTTVGVPDGGTTVLLLGMALSGLGWFSRRLA